MARMSSLCSPDHKRVLSGCSGTTEAWGPPVGRGPVPRTRRSSSGHIKVLSDLFSGCLLMSIDIQGLSDLAFILAILQILPILLQTNKKKRGGQATAMP